MRLTVTFVAALLLAVPADAQVQSPDDAGRIAGHVVSAYAELMAGVTVTLGGRNDQGAGLRVQTTTDSRGAFSFEQLPPGRYRVIASRQGYTGRQADPQAEPGEFFEAGPAVDLTEGAQVLDVQVVLHRTASIAGRVIRPDGSAAADVRVQAAVRAATGFRPLIEAQTTSQFDGRYEITGLPPGDYLVGAMNVAMPTRQTFDVRETTREERNKAVATAATGHWSWYPGVSDSEPGNTVTVLEGVNAEGIDIWLTPSQRFYVSGRVFWPVGVAVDNITIDYGDPAGARSGLWLVSDPGGLFTLSGIAPGALTMLVRAETDQGMLMGIATTEVTRRLGRRRAHRRRSTGPCLRSHCLRRECAGLVARDIARRAAEASESVCAVSGAGGGNRLERTLRTAQHGWRVRVRTRRIRQRSFDQACDAQRARAADEPDWRCPR